jgi:hypothetical protein
MASCTAIIKQDSDWWIGWVAEVACVKGGQAVEGKYSQIFYQR